MRLLEHEDITDENCQFFGAEILCANLRFLCKCKLLKKLCGCRYFEFVKRVCGRLHRFPKCNEKVIVLGSFKYFELAQSE